MLTYRTRLRTTQIILHDSHTVPDLESSSPFLVVNGRALGLLNVGYHYVIERDGFTTEYRRHDAIGSHTRGCNHNSIGVCLMGGCRATEDGGVEPEDNFTADQMVSLKALVLAIRQRYGKNLPLVGHKEVSRGHSECPCLNMETVRDLVR